MSSNELETVLCKSLCAEVKLHEKRQGFYFLETPFLFSDGDYFSIYLKKLPGGDVRLTDRGHTIMHLSYASDVDTLFEGTRGRLMEEIQAELGIREEDGEFFLEAPQLEAGPAALRFAQALTKITDLSFLSRVRVQSSFYEDLQQLIFEKVPPEKVQKNYVVQNVEHGELYPIDYRIEGKDKPLFLFGIPNDEKARLVTIILQHLQAWLPPFESLLVFADQTRLSRADLARLSNAGGEQISSLDEYEQFERKLLKRIATNGQAPELAPQP